MNRCVGGLWTRSVVEIRGPGVSVFELSVIVLGLGGIVILSKSRAIKQRKI